MAKKKHKNESCCYWFANALDPGTDNEGYRSLIYFIDGEYRIGSEPLPEMKFCPWCGREVGKYALMFEIKEGVLKCTE